MSDEVCPSILVSIQMIIIIIHTLIRHGKHARHNTARGRHVQGIQVRSQVTYKAKGGGSKSVPEI